MIEVDLPEDFYESVEMSPDHSSTFLISRTNEAVLFAKVLISSSRSTVSNSQDMTHHLRVERISAAVQRSQMKKDLERLKHGLEAVGIAQTALICPTEITTENPESFLQKKNAKLVAHTEQMCASSTALIVRSKGLMQRTTHSMQSFDTRQNLSPELASGKPQPVSCTDRV